MKSVSILTPNEEIITMYLRGESPVFVLDEETTADGLIEAARKASEADRRGRWASRPQTRTPKTRAGDSASLLSEAAGQAEAQTRAAAPAQPEAGLQAMQLRLDGTLKTVLGRSLFYS